MKKNISINLYDTLYNIDDDAYALLDNYLKSMQRCFNQENGGEEVADDIEHRVAELLWQRKEAGADTVSIEQVKEIIATIGMPEEIGGEEDHTQGEETETQAEGGRKKAYTDACTDWSKSCAKRKLYRSADDQKIAGVCAGLATFCDLGSPTAWRIATLIVSLLLLCFGGSVVFLLIGYLMLWIVVPKAVTPEDRLRMLGKEVTPENVTQQVMNDAHYAAQLSHSSDWGTRIFKVLFVILLVCLAAPAFFALLVSLTCAMMSLPVSASIGFPMITSAMGIGDIQPWIDAVTPWAIVLFICCLLLFVLPIVGIMRGIFGKRGMSKSSIMWGIVAWFIILALGIGDVIYMVLSFDAYQQNQKDEAALNISVHTMQKVGWNLDESENLFPTFIQAEMLSGILPHHSFFLRAQNRKVNSGTYTAVFSKEENLPENGTYTFIAVTRKCQGDLTYTFRYTSGGEEKEVVLQPTLPGVKLCDGSYEEYAPYGFDFTYGCDFWTDFMFESTEDWQVHSIDVENVDAGKGTLTIAARMCKDSVKIFDVKVVKR